MDSFSSPSEPRLAGVMDVPRSRPGAKVTDQQFINDSDDELRALHQRAGFAQIAVQTHQRLQIALARKGQP